MSNKMKKTDLSALVSPSYAMNESNLESSFIPTATLPNNKLSKSYIEAMKALQNKIKSLEIENQGLQSQSFTLKQQIDRITFDCEGKENLFLNLEKNLKEKLSSMEKEKAFALKALEEKNKEVEEYRLKMEEMDTKNNEEYKNFLKIKTELKVSLKTCEDRLETEEITKKELEGEINHLRSVKQQLEIEKQKILGDIERNAKDHERKLDECEKEKEKKVEKIKELNRQIEIEKNEKNQLKKQINEYQLIQDKLSNNIEELKYILAQKENDILVLRERIKSVERENQLFTDNNVESYGSIDEKALTENTKKKNEIEKKGLLIEKTKRTYENEQENFQSYSPPINIKNMLRERNYNMDEEYLRKIDDINKKKFEVPSLQVENEENSEKPYYNNNNYLDERQTRIRTEYEQTVENIIHLEKELIKYMDEYKALSNKSVEGSKNSQESFKLKERLSNVNEMIHKINQEILDLKKNEEELISLL